MTSAQRDPPSVRTDGDLDLIQALRGGDAAAGDALVKKYCRPLMGYLVRLAGDPQVAEELHQQTWLSVLDHLDKFNPEASRGGVGGFKAWLFRIATNKANDHWRSAGRDKAAREVLGSIGHEPAPHAGQRLEQTEEEQKLAEAIQRLPENQKEVLLLRYYGNLKFVEIAEMLGCPLNTALGRAHKAILKLKDMMQDVQSTSTTREQRSGAPDVPGR